MSEEQRLDEVFAKYDKAITDASRWNTIAACLILPASIVMLEVAVLLAIQIVEAVR